MKRDVQQQQQQQTTHSQVMANHVYAQAPTLPAGPPPIAKKPEHLPPTKRITEMVIRLLR